MVKLYDRGGLCRKILYDFWFFKKTIFLIFDFFDFFSILNRKKKTKIKVRMNN